MNLLLYADPIYNKGFRKKRFYENLGNNVWREFGKVVLDEKSYNTLDDIDLYDYDSMHDFKFSDELMEYINSKFEKVIFFTANLISDLREDIALEIISFLERLKIPIVVLGIGVQADTSFSLKEICDLMPSNIKKLIRLLYERSNGAIGTRGEFSAEIFKRYGFSDVTVTGCPSLYSAGKVLKIKEINDIEKIAFYSNGYEYDINKKFSDLYKYCDLEYIVQTDELLKELLVFGKKSRVFKKYKNNFSMNWDIFKLKEMLNNERVKTFFDVYDWYEHLKGLDITLGIRIHGCLLSLIAGTPSILIPIDHRTKEMATYYDIPYIEKEDFMRKGFTISKINNNLNFSKTEKTYRKRRKKYFEFLERFNIAYLDLDDYSGRIIQHIRRKDSFFKMRKKVGIINNASFFIPWCIFNQQNTIPKRFSAKNIMKLIK